MTDMHNTVPVTQTIIKSKTLTNKTWNYYALLATVFLLIFTTLSIFSHNILPTPTNFIDGWSCVVTSEKETIYNATGELPFNLQSNENISVANKLLQEIDNLKSKDQIIIHNTTCSIINHTTDSNVYSEPSHVFLYTETIWLANIDCNFNYSVTVTSTGCVTMGFNCTAYNDTGKESFKCKNYKSINEGVPNA